MTRPTRYTLTAVALAAIAAVFVTLGIKVREFHFVIALPFLGGAAVAAWLAISVRGS